MKNFKAIQRFSFILFCLSILVACGNGSSPSALQPVKPGDDSNIQELFPDEETITLYQAIVAQGVPADLTQKALLKYDQFKGRVRNHAYLTMIDFRQHSGRKRFYMVNRTTGAVSKWTVAHGTGTDPDNDGFAQYFSNIPNSRMSSLGTYLIAEKYIGKYGQSLRLDGLESTNSNARARAIVLHPSNYVKDTSAKQGRSWGCPAIPYDWIKTVITRAQGGSFLYAHGTNRRSAVNDAALLEQWELIPKSQWVNESEEAPIDGE